MRKKIFSILAGVMMIALTVAGAVYARESTDLEIEGRVTEVGPNYLIVDGERYEIVFDSEVDEGIIVNDWVKITYYEKYFEGPGTLLIIIEVEIEDEPEMDYEEFEIYGTVEDLSEEILTVDVNDILYDFLIMGDSEIEDDIEVGDYVKVKFYEDEEGQLFLIEVELEDENDDEMDDDDMELGAVCSGDLMHPVLTKLADEYGADYETLKGYFCDGFGVGEIKLALKTAQLDEVDETFEEILMLRITDGMKDVGWGEIWQEMGLIGKGKQENEEKENQALKNKHQEAFQFEGEEEQFEYEAKNKEKNENKPDTPPGLSGGHPGKGKGRGN